MNYLFFISDTFLWTLLIGLIVWTVILGNQVAKLDRTLKNIMKQSEPARIWQKTDEPEQKAEQMPENKQPVSENIYPEVKNEENYIPAKPPEYTAPKQIKTPAQKTTIETVFLGNIFNKIGAIALIIAFIFFIKMVSPYIIITDTIKILLGAGAGLGLFLGGLHLHTTEKFKNYSEVLIGTGFATLFITSFCAYHLKVLNTPAALTAGGILLLFVFFVSHKMRSVSSLVIGLIGGYLTPYLSGATYDISFAYLIFLNIVSLIYTLKNSKAKFITPINLFITMFIMFAGCLASETPKIVYPVILWASYILYDLLRDKSSKIDNAAGIVNYIFLTLITMTLFKTSVEAVGIMFGITALIYAILAFAGKKFQNPLYKRYEHYIFLNIWFSILFTLNDLYSIITWSVAALILSFAVKKDKLNAVKHYITIYYLSAFAGVLLAKDGSVYMIAEHYTPVINLRSLIFLVPVLCMILSIGRLKGKEQTICNWMRFNIVLLTYAYIICEISNLLNTLSMNGSYPAFMIYTAMGFVYSVLLYSMHKKSASLLLNIAAVFFGITSVFMFIVGCFMQSSGLLPVLNMRVLAFITVLYFCNYYTKNTRLNLFRYLAILLGFLLCGAESSLIGSKLNTSYMTTMGWLLYSGAITLFGILKSKKFMINSGIWILVFTILRMFIYDLAKIESVYKILAFLVLGIVLMIISYIYVKLKNDTK